MHAVYPTKERNLHEKYFTKIRSGITQIKAIEAALPFPLKGFDCDNGSEFLNHHLVNYFSTHPEEPSFTRSRPYKKNDNAHVEQKNWSQVRQLFGYDRFDNSKLVALMNDLYAHEWSQMQNHFCHTLKLKEKSREGSRYKKCYHTPETPYQRVIASDAIPNSPETAQGQPRYSQSLCSKKAN